jgi:hypothetical protein
MYIILDIFLLNFKENNGRTQTNRAPPYSVHTIATGVLYVGEGGGDNGASVHYGDTLKGDS